jgi:hypothetical protein
MGNLMKKASEIKVFEIVFINIVLLIAYSFWYFMNSGSWFGQAQTGIEKIYQYYSMFGIFMLVSSFISLGYRKIAFLFTLLALTPLIVFFAWQVGLFILA